VFKEDLQGLTDRLGIEIRIAHFPPYCSKFNLLALQRHLMGLRHPIEHRLFPHVTRALQGVVLEGVAVVKQFMEKTSTSTGLKVVVRCLEKVYATGRTCVEGFRDSKWNDVTVPGLG
jgi:hypothetical protein